MNGEATILHADLDSFFASVEQRDDPALRGRPVLVGGGVVVAASYEAKAYGVRTPMGIVEAKSLCPGAVVASPRFEAYSAASKAVFEVFRDTTPLVDPISIDEAFMEVGGLARLVGSPESIAARLRERVLEEVGLPITVGVARTKFLAKVASAFAKPDGLLVVPVDGERAFLHPLPVERMWGVGAKTAAKLRARGVENIGDLAAVPPHALAAYVGRAAAYHLHSLANGQDPRPVETGKRRGSVGAQRALGRRPKTMEEIDSALAGLVDRVSRRMRKAEREGRTVTLRLRFDDFTRATRSHTLPRPTARTERLLIVARSLLDVAEPLIRERGCTLVGISVSGFDPHAGGQLELPFGEPDTATLDLALDDVRERFGSAAVLRGSLVRRGEGFAMPTLPD
ncbi:DNA polymerase IV [Mumia sp. DW29H23]|uniref:DNA polymerase IV n=1 Tax=Mumia sp. DW29H23 TaxID=3421241 RepID=UPI003D68778E